MAGLCFLSGIMGMYLPETLGRIFPNTVEEVLSWPRDLTKEQWEDIKVRRSELWGKVKDGWHGRKSDDKKTSDGYAGQSYPDKGLSNPAFSVENGTCYWKTPASATDGRNTPDVTRF